ncbi:homoserine kinase [Cohnella sp. CIP 111063]|uniref:homoserine kinase n=1 Tax=unclassified Cohnella TaxID=2636738 RepID=UPI000B8BB9C9|nr:MULTISPECIES: homoserine kinase [unclassified Cohnella]OXS57954.1 homoserine kinase [Cohnella sp. CIP 111063]PRX71281.1 homoserine kinase [Cohnella sp. SGD-V74]
MQAASATGSESGRVVVKVPASTANLGPGFDSLGMALSLFAWVSMAPAEQTRILLVGGNLEGVPEDKTNLIYEVAQAVFRKAGVDLPELEIGIRSDIPLTRGLGSSAAAIVGALVAANALTGYALSEDELFQMASELEKHPDNVGASLFGGIIAASWDGERADYVRIEPPEGLEVMAAIPEFELETKKARSALPEQVSMKDAVFNVTHSSLLTAALASGRLDLLSRAMRDRLHQPYRAALIPGMETILREAPDHGALGAALSGAGPTLLLLADTAQMSDGKLAAFVERVMSAEGIRVETRWLKVCLHGPQVRHVAKSDPEFGQEPQAYLLSVQAEVGV